MSSLPPLPESALYHPCDLQGFDTTDDLQGGEELISQTRAREAFELGLEIAGEGYNLFVVGPAGLGKRTMASALVGARAKTQPRASDWCYVHNFHEPHKPNALRLPAGLGVKLRNQMRQFVEDLQVLIPALFDSEEYRARSEQISAQMAAKQERPFRELGDEAAKEGFALIHSPMGFTLAPTKEGEVMTPEEFSVLPPEEKQAKQAKLLDFQERLQKIVRQAQQLLKENREKIKALNREMVQVLVNGLTGDLCAGYEQLPDVLAYLNEVKANVLESSEEFRQAQEQDGAPRNEESPSFRRYEVNVLVGDHEYPEGAPVIHENNPTYPNLLGRVEYISKFGTLLTDFNLIRGGALHRANGGYLLLDARKVLSQPWSWEGLKRALAARQVSPESPAQSYGWISTVGLEPEPIPLALKVVLFGDRYLYYMLSAYDPEFLELFKVTADFEEDIERSEQSEISMARLIAAMAKQEELLPFDRGGVARAIEHLARASGDSQRLSTQIEDLKDLAVQANAVARRAQQPVVRGADVQAALDERERRDGRARERVQRAIQQGDLLIDSDGETVGQVNALSVVFTGSSAFAFPTRITANVRLGEGEVIDIQREVKLGGPIHSKGVMILESYLATRFSAKQPHCLTASLVFEQTYGEVEGDSASVAELCALLSAIGGFALRQWLAVTGSVNQLGQVQPIGGVNEKIEGFFDVCRARGLKGSQGVVIPSTNVRHLMLRKDVREAVRAGRFHIYAVSGIAQAIELLSGLDAGAAGPNGEYPKGSVNHRVGARLKQFASIRKAYA
ncbi:MAG: Lon protease family protein, partial [Burkholderiales bacterium]